jgi:hypothetical protein
MIERACRAGLAGLSAVAILLFMVGATTRASNPFARDAVEGAWLNAIARVAAGHAPYAEPSLEYVALPAMPGFTLAAAALVRGFGTEPWVPRALALAATLAIAWLVASVVRRETDSLLLGLAGAGLLLGAGSLLALDAARPEALALAGLAVLRFTTGVWGALAAAGLMTLAWTAAHHALWLVGAAVVHLAVGDRRRLLPFALGAAAGCVAAGWLLARWLGPWFAYHAFDLVAHGLRLDAVRLAQVSGPGLVGTLGTLALAVLLAAALPVPMWRGQVGIWWWGSLGGALASIAGATEPRASSPGLVPALMVLAIGGPVAMIRVVNHLAAWPGAGRAGRSWVLQAALMLSFAPVLGEVAGRLPADRFRSEHARLIERLRALPGPVIAPGFGWDAARAGKGASFDPVALEALVRARAGRRPEDDPPVIERVLAPLRDGSARAWVVVERPLEDAPGDDGLWAAMAERYQRVAEWSELAEAPAPRFVYEPRGGPSVAEARLDRSRTIAGGARLRADSAGVR